MEMRNAYKILFGKPEEKRQLQRHEHNWDANIKMAVKELGV
jgi:hypothetical protein